MDTIDLLKIRPLNNFVLVRVDHEVESIKLRSGIELKIDTSYDQFKHSPSEGEVIALPDSLKYGKMMEGSLLHKTQQELKVGDKVIFHYLVFHNAVYNTESGNARYFLQNGKIYLFVKYDQIFLAMRDSPFGNMVMSEADIYANSLVKGDDDTWKSVIMVNGYCLLEPIEHDYSATESIGIVIPEYIKKRADANYGIVRYLGSCNEEYKFGGYPNDDDTLAVNDVVGLDQNCDIPLQYSMHNTFNKDINYWRVERKNIKSIVANVNDESYSTGKFISKR